MRVELHGTGSRHFVGLHGWSGDHQTFAPLSSFVPEDATLHSLDLPGCGFSPAPRAWTIDSVAREIAQYVKAIEYPVVLIGNCSGANLAFFVARLVPERVERVVAIDTFADWPWYFRVFVNPVFGRYAYFVTFANPLGRWLTNRSLRSKRAEDVSLTEGFSRKDHTVTYRYLTMLRDGGGVEQFAGLRMPVDIAFGERSFRKVRESAEVFRAMWPQARVFPLRGAGHLPLLEAPDQLARLIFGSPSESATKENSECQTAPAHCAS